MLLEDYLGLRVRDFCAAHDVCILAKCCGKRGSQLRSLLDGVA